MTDPRPSQDSDGEVSDWDEDTEWVVAGVVGEEIHSATGASFYEVRWDGWEREDGSNTTWETSLEISNAPGNRGDPIGKWRHAFKRHCKDLDDLEDIKPGSGWDIQRDRTREIAQGIREKRALKDSLSLKHTLDSLLECERFCNENEDTPSLNWGNPRASSSAPSVSSASAQSTMDLDSSSGGDWTDNTMRGSSTVSTGSSLSRQSSQSQLRPRSARIESRMNSTQMSLACDSFACSPSTASQGRGRGRPAKKAESLPSLPGTGTSSIVSSRGASLSNVTVSSNNPTSSSSSTRPDKGKGKMKIEDVKSSSNSKAQTTTTTATRSPQADTTTKKAVAKMKIEEVAPSLTGKAMTRSQVAISSPSRRKTTGDTAPSLSRNKPQTPAFLKAVASPSQNLPSVSKVSPLTTIKVEADLSSSQIGNTKNQKPVPSLTGKATTKMQSAIFSGRKIMEDIVPSLSSNKPQTPASFKAVASPSRNLPPVIKASPLTKLQRSWTAKAKLAGAAPITIVNDQDNDEAPPLDAKFMYLERSYHYDASVPAPPDDDFFLCCECDVCSHAEQCGCQANSEVIGGSFEEKLFAYNTQKLFTFEIEDGDEVIECNKGCSCDESCPNRVAQLPRDVPVEIFKTDRCGWGVRSPQDIVRGKVLGIYTGKLMSREVSNATDREGSNYYFDLDSREIPGEDEDGLAKYTVDAFNHGNWTRFINHSCEPNLKAYNVVFDTIPDANTPYMAFVATQNIAAGTELTFDYFKAVRSEQSPTPSNRKRKKRRISDTPPPAPEGASRCNCGASNCRRFLMF